MPTIIVNNERILFCNTQFSNLLGYSQKEIESIGFKRIIEPNQRRSFYKKLVGALQGLPFDEQGELCLKAKDGQWLWVEYKSKIVSYGEEVFIEAHLLDITEKKKVQLHLSRLLLLRESMLEVTQSIVHVENMEILYKKILFNAIHSIEHAKLGTILLKDGSSLKMVAQIGFEPSSIEGFEIPINQSFLYKAVGSGLDKIAKIDNVIEFDDYYHFRSVDGCDDFIRSSISAPIYINKEFFGVVNIDSHQFNAFDDDDLKMMEFVRNNVEIAISNHLLYEEKVFLARYDSMTNIFNRRYFDEMFEFLRDKAQRYGEEFNLVIFDVNGLKNINDEHGHLVGDMVIQKFASDCSEMIRKCDVFARYGGDEFIGIFFESTKATLSRKFEDHQGYLKNTPINVNGNEVYISFSYGISTFREDGIIFDDLFKIADEKMYQYKMRYKQEITLQTIITRSLCQQNG